MQFASYPTAFNNTVLRKFAYEISRDAEDKTVAASAKIAATALLMSGTATITNAIRSGGRSLEKDQGLVILDSVDRWGGLGPMQYGYRYWENLQRGSGPIGGVLKAVSGPAQQDALDSILYRKGIFEPILFTYICSTLY